MSNYQSNLPPVVEAPQATHTAGSPASRKLYTALEIAMRFKDSRKKFSRANGEYCVSEYVFKGALDYGLLNNMQKLMLIHNILTAEAKRHYFLSEKACSSYHSQESKPAKNLTKEQGQNSSRDYGILLFNYDSLNHLVSVCPKALELGKSTKSQFEYYNKRNQKNNSAHRVLDGLCSHLEEIDTKPEDSSEDDPD